LRLICIINWARNPVAMLVAGQSQCVNRVVKQDNQPRIKTRNPTKPNQTQPNLNPTNIKNGILKMSTMTTTAACAECKYWEKKAENSGECRRHAPQTIAFQVDSETKIESRFPVTAAADYCGDFEAK